MTPAAQIDGLEIKLRQLAAKVERQRTQHQALVAENEDLKQELDRQLGVVNALKDKLGQIPAVNGSATTDDQRETIAYCLREIDRCIEWLHRN